MRHRWKGCDMKKYINIIIASLNTFTKVTLYLAVITQTTENNGARITENGSSVWIKWFIDFNWVINALAVIRCRVMWISWDTEWQDESDTSADSKQALTCLPASLFWITNSKNVLSGLNDHLVTARLLAFWFKAYIYVHAFVSLPCRS